MSFDIIAALNSTENIEFTKKLSNTPSQIYDIIPVQNNIENTKDTTNISDMNIGTALSQPNCDLNNAVPLTPMQQDLTVSIVPPVQSNIPMQLMAEETKYLNTINSNHSAKKKIKEVQNDLALEERIISTKNYLKSLSLLQFSTSPGNYTPHIDWHLLPQDVYNFVNTIAKTTGWGRFEILLIFLGSIAMAMRGRYVMKIKDLWVEPLILYQILSAPSGTNKSLIDRIFKAPFMSHFEQLQEETHKDRNIIAQKQLYLNKFKATLQNKLISSIITRNYDEDNDNYDFDSMFADAENILQDIKKKAAKYEKIFTAIPRFFGEDSTYKAILRIMNQQGGAVAFFGEEGSRLIELLKDSSAMRDLILKGYTTETFIRDTIRESIYISRPVLNILFLVQPIIVQNIFKNENLKLVGVTPRFLPYFCSVTGNINNDNQGISDMFQWYNKKITKMLNRNFTQDTNMPPFICSVTHESQMLLNQFHANMANFINDKQFNHMESFLLKSHGHAARFAGIMHTSRFEFPEQHPITPNDVQLGIQIVKAHISHVSFATKDMHTQYDANKIIAWIKRHQHDQFKARDIAQGISNMNNANIFPALDFLEKHNIIAQIIIPNRSRICVVHPSFNYHIN